MAEPDGRVGWRTATRLCQDRPPDHPKARDLFDAVKTLLLLRHAKSSWNGETSRDFDRPLAPRGRKAAARMGRLLVEQGLVPDIVLCSPASRAEETWDEVAPLFPVGTEARLEDRLYLADPGVILRLVQRLPDAAARALVIGHNPGMEQLARYLAGSGDGEALGRMAHKFPTAGLAVLDFEIDSWSHVAPGGGRLESFVAPREIEA